MGSRRLYFIDLSSILQDRVYQTIDYISGLALILTDRRPERYSKRFASRKFDS
jgi:hypothetical protein